MCKKNRVVPHEGILRERDGKQQVLSLLKVGKCLGVRKEADRTKKMDALGWRDWSKL